MVVVPPVASSLLPEPFAHPLPPPAAGFHIAVWLAPTVQVLPPIVVMVSITTSPATVVALTEGMASFLFAPKGPQKISFQI